MTTEVSQNEVFVVLCHSHEERDESKVVGVFNKYNDALKYIYVDMTGSTTFDYCDNEYFSEYDGRYRKIYDFNNLEELNCILKKDGRVFPCLDTGSWSIKKTTLNPELNTQKNKTENNNCVYEDFDKFDEINNVINIKGISGSIIGC